MASRPVDAERSGEAGSTCYAGWMLPGEWLEYSVQGEGRQRLTLRAGSGMDERSLQVSLDGVPVKTVHVPKTSWETFDDGVVEGIEFNGSEQRLRVTFPDGAVNLLWLKFEQQ